MTLPGVNDRFNVPTSGQTHSFRQWSVSQPEGSVPAHIVEGTVIDLNFKLWTVDVLSKFDQKTYLNIQVGSPYIHSRAGEGIYIFPDLGAKCHVCIPSDSSPPFVLDFIMPQETLPSEKASDEASAGDGDSESFTFAGGRVRPKAGDIYIKGRDGNFVVLHKGGVLQIGSTELAQRIYIPLQNLVTDISQNYRHYNTGGAINWFLAPGDSEYNPRTLYRETYRLRAGDEKASIRITSGLLKDFLSESGECNSNMTQLGIGTQALGDKSGNPIVYEVVLSPDQFDADSGATTQNTSKQSKLRFFFDQAGGSFLRSESSVYMKVKRGLRLDVGGALTIHTDDSFELSANKTGRVDGGKLLELQGGVTKINGGSKPVAHVGSQVVIVLTKPLNGTSPGGPVVIPPVDPLMPMGNITLVGTIQSGNSTILV